MSYQSTVLADSSLVAYWQLDETSGSVAHDSKGTRDGFYNFSPTLNRVGPSSFIPRSVLFNGVNSFVEVPTDPVFHPGWTYPYFTPTTYSIEAWVKILLPFTGGSTIAGVHFMGDIPPVGVVHAEETGGFLLDAYGSFGGFDGGWHYVVETFDGTWIRDYKDNTLAGTFGPFSPSWPKIPDTTSQPFVIGGFGADSWNGYDPSLYPSILPTIFVNGYIAQVAFYNQALSSSRIGAHWFAAFNPTGGGSTFTKAASSQVVFTPVSANVPIVLHGQTQLTQLVAEVARLQSDGFAYLTQLVVEVIRPYVAGSVDTFDVAATAQIVFGATAQGHRARLGEATAEVVFTGTVNAFHGLYKVASARVVFTAVAALDNVKIGHVASVTIIFKPRAKNLFLPIVFSDDYLGRFQLGQEVPLWDMVRDQHGQPSLPTVEPPEARIYNLDTRQHVETVDLVRQKGSRNGSIYTRALRLGALYQVGRHGVTFRAPSGGFVGYNLAIFEVVDGGDISGPVIATHTFPAPGGDQIMAHLASGALAKGARPRIS